MNWKEFKLIKTNNVNSKRFSFWITFRNRSDLNKKQQRKNLIKYLTECLGPLGNRWEYSHVYDNIFILKLNNEKDFLLVLLKFN